MIATRRRFPVTHKHGSPTYEQHILEILERAKQAVSQAQRQIAVSQKLHRDSDELLDKINASYQFYPQRSPKTGQ